MEYRRKPAFTGKEKGTGKGAMDHNLKLEIVNDTPFKNLTYMLTLNQKSERITQRQTILRRETTSETREVRVKLRKKDIWSAEKRGAHRFWLLMDVLDVFFGSLSDSDHLPFSIEYKCPADSGLQERKILLVSRLLRTKRENVALWSRYTTAQYIMVSLLLAFFVLLASVVFSGVFKALWLVGCAAAIGTLLFFRIKRRNKIKKELLVYSAEEEEAGLPAADLEASGEQ